MRQQSSHDGGEACISRTDRALQRIPRKAMIAMRGALDSDRKSPDTQLKREAAGAT
jgi:hypothetical protein